MLWWYQQNTGSWQLCNWLPHTSTTNMTVLTIDISAKPNERCGAWTPVIAPCSYISFWFWAWQKSRRSQKSLYSSRSLRLLRPANPSFSYSSSVLPVPLEFHSVSAWLRLLTRGLVCWPIGVTFAVCSDSCTFALWMISIQSFHCLRLRQSFSSQVVKFCPVWRYSYVGRGKRTLSKSNII